MNTNMERFIYAFVWFFLSPFFIHGAELPDQYREKLLNTEGVVAYEVTGVSSEGEILVGVFVNKPPSEIKKLVPETEIIKPDLVDINHPAPGDAYFVFQNLTGEKAVERIKVPTGKVDDVILEKVEPQPPRGEGATVVTYHKPTGCRDGECYGSVFEKDGNTVCPYCGDSFKRLVAKEE